MLKQCTACKQWKDIEADFAWKKQGKLRQARCKSCQKIISYAHYRDNKRAYFEKSHKRTKDIIDDNYTKIEQYLSLNPCIDCGNADPRVLEFDHVREKKTTNIATMVRYGYSWQSIEEEIAKCEVRCANCHRIRTAISKGFWRLWIAAENEAEDDQ